MIFFQGQSYLGYGQTKREGKPPRELRHQGSPNKGKRLLEEKETRLLTRPTQKMVAQLVKNLPTVQETWVQSPGQEDPLEKKIATHSGNLAWEIPGTEEPGGLWFMGLRKSWT